MKAIRYHRFSSKKQDRGSSLERQNENTNLFCKAKGWEVIETLEDKGQSAWKGDHLGVGELGRLRKRIDAGIIEPGTYVVVENLDRLSRQDYRIARRWIEDVTDRGIVIAVCRPELILDRQAMSGANIVAIIQHLLESNRATAESDRKSQFQQRNIARMTDMIRAGLCPSPRVPAWLVATVGEPLRVDEERAGLVRVIYEWSASGLGLQSICKRLNADHPTWTGEGWKTGRDQWRIGYVRDILKSAPAEGKFVVRGNARKPTGEIITGYYPRIVDADLVERARSAIDRRAGTGGRAQGEARNLFMGLMTCKSCGGAVGRVVTRGYAYMNCRNSRYGTCQNKAATSYDVLAKAIVDKLLHLALDDTHFAAVDDVAPLLARVATTKSAIETLKTERNNLVQALRRLSDSTGLIDELSRIEADLAGVIADHDSAAAALATARGNVSPAEHLLRVHDVRDRLDSDPEARRMVRDALPTLIERMVWDGETTSVVGPHFVLKVARNGSIRGWDMLHPRGANAYPQYARRRIAAIDAGTFITSATA